MVYFAQVVQLFVHYKNLPSTCTCALDRKKVVKVTLQRADVGLLAAESITPQKRGHNLGYFVRKFRQIKVRN